MKGQNFGLPPLRLRDIITKSLDEITVFAMMPSIFSEFIRPSGKQAHFPSHLLDAN